jgi:broad specificity phosphatase PhoE
MAGAVILARHGEPALSRRVMLSSQGYRDWWARYEEGGLKAGQAPPLALVDAAKTAGAVFSSTRERSRQSAEAICAGRPFQSDPLFIEAPLPSPPLPACCRLSPRWWGVLSRVFWQAFDYHDGQESRAQAAARARQAARFLIEQTTGGQDVLLIAHGYFNFMIGRSLKAEGWRRAGDQGFKYWSARRFEPGLRSATRTGVR